MKVLQVLPYFYPAWDYGGPVKSTLTISEELVRRGHEVSVLTTDTLNGRSRIPNRLERKDGVEIIRLKNLSNWLAYKMKVFTPRGSADYLRYNLKAYDIVHLQEYRNLLNVAVYRQCVADGIPFVISARGTLPVSYGRPILKRSFDHAFGHTMLRAASAAVALTPTEANQYKEFRVPPSKIHLIPNGFDYRGEAPRPDEFLKAHAIPAEAIRILFLARLSKVKGLGRAVHAMRKVILSHERAHLVVVGPDDGYLKSALSLVERSGLREHVTFCGPLYGEEKQAAFAACDIYMLPSEMEGLPNSVIEAMASGLPVVVSEACNMSFWVKDQAGIVANTPDEIADALLLLLQDTSLRRRYGAQAKALVESEFRVDAVVEKTHRLYSKMAQRSPYGR